MPGRNGDMSRRGRRVPGAGPVVLPSRFTVMPVSRSLHPRTQGLTQRLLAVFDIKAVYDHGKRQLTIHAPITGATPRPSPTCWPTPRRPQPASTPTPAAPDRGGRGVVPPG